MMHGKGGKLYDKPDTTRPLNKHTAGKSETSFDRIGKRETEKKSILAPKSSGARGGNPGQETLLPGRGAAYRQRQLRKKIQL